MKTYKSSRVELSRIVKDRQRQKVEDVLVASIVLVLLATAGVLFLIIEPF